MRFFFRLSFWYEGRNVRNEKDPAVFLSGSDAILFIHFIFIHSIFIYPVIECS